MTIYRIVDLQFKREQFFSDLSFLDGLDITEKNFKNRWRCRTGCGLVIKGFIFVELIEVKGKKECKQN